MKSNKIIGVLLLLLVIAGGVFFGGKYYLDAKEQEEIVQEEAMEVEIVDLSGWHVDETGWHYTDSNGQMIVDQHITSNDQDFYIDQNGNLATNWYQEGEIWYFRDFAGRSIRGWMEQDGTWYYLNPENGAMATGWADIDGTWYYMNQNGGMQTGWTDVDGKYYYLSDSGAMKTGWINEGDTYYYLNADGVMQTGWITVDGKTYYMKDNGSMATGRQEIDGKTYEFDSNGQRYTGWMTIDANQYYFDGEGVMQTGWVTIDGKTYYLDQNGMMRKGWIHVDGKSVYLDGNGVYQPNVTLPSTEAGPMIALTFDDGPGKYTGRLLNALETNHVKATFFMLGSLVNQYPNEVRRMKSLGCEIGNHSYDHANLTKLDAAGVQSQISRTNDNLKSIIGEGATVIRPPYGAYNDFVKQNTGAPLILWSIDTLDWSTLNAQATIDCVLNEVKDGDIILMHDIHQTSVEAAETLIPELIKRGYQLVTVSEMAAAKGKCLSAGSAYGSFH